MASNNTRAANQVVLDGLADGHGDATRGVEQRRIRTASTHNKRHESDSVVVLAIGKRGHLAPGLGGAGDVGNGVVVCVQVRTGAVIASSTNRGRGFAEQAWEGIVDAQDMMCHMSMYWVTAFRFIWSACLAAACRHPSMEHDVWRTADALKRRNTPAAVPDSRWRSAHHRQVPCAGPGRGAAGCWCRLDTCRPRPRRSGTWSMRF